jgi:hypothetical protein
VSLEFPVTELVIALESLLPTQPTLNIHGKELLPLPFPHHSPTPPLLGKSWTCSPSPVKVATRTESILKFVRHTRLCLTAVNLKVTVSCTWLSTVLWKGKESRKRIRWVVGYEICSFETSARIERTGDPLRWPLDILYPQKVAPTSSESLDLYSLLAD